VISLLFASMLGPCVTPQSPPPNGGSTAGAATRSGTAPDLADILTRMRSRSGGQQSGGGRFSPPGGTNVKVSSSSASSQYAPTIAVDPTDPLHLVACALDSRNAPDRNAAYYASFDGGATWSEFLDTHTAPFEANASAVAFGRNGETRQFQGLELAPYSYLNAGTSTDGGVTEPTWIYSYSSAYESSVAVDRSSGPYANYLYVAAVYFTFQQGYYYTVSVSTSSDGGQSWTYSDAFHGGSHSLESTALAVDSAGVVHVVFYDDVTTSITTVSSADGGATWGPPSVISNAKPFDIPNLATSVHPAPKLATDISGGPFDGTLYVAWAQSGGPTGPNVVFSSSADHGATWSTPSPASDVTTNSQYTPCIAVDPQGNLDVGFYDCRDDPSNARVNFYLSRSSDGGQTLQPNVKVSDVDFDPTAYATGTDVTLRSGIDSSERTLHAIWTDGRNGDNDVYTAAVELDFHTDVSKLSASTGGTVTFTVSPGPLFQNDLYQIVGSTSGTSPGLDLFFVHLPLNFDPFFAWTIVLANGSSLPGFLGTLDATGSATGSLVSGPLPPALIGYQMDFAVVVEVGSAFRWASDATHLEIGN
jgi:BNR repeat protein